MPDIKLGSLFDGIGVFPLAASRCGIRPVWASEIEKAPISITKRHFPDMAHLGDITKVDGGKIPPVHVITFGSPCQNLSLIGNRSGLAGAKSSLFYQAFRIIQEMRDATLGQNVPKLDALYLMDGIEGLRSLPKHSVDMLLTDPPYGTTRNFWDVPLPFPELWDAVRWAVKPNGAILFFAQCPFDKVLGASNLAMLRYEWVWYKSRATGFLNANRAPLKKSENILVFYQKSPVYHPQFTYGEPYRKTNPRSGCSTNYGKFERTGSESSDGRRYPGNVLFVPTVTGGIHPTQKPVELCEYFIKTYTDEGAVVADICAGSGTTAVAAMNTHRRFICFENAPSIYTIAAQRIEQARLAMAGGEKGE